MSTQTRSGTYRLTLVALTVDPSANTEAKLTERSTNPETKIFMQAKQNASGQVCKLQAASTRLTSELIRQRTNFDDTSIDHLSPSQAKELSLLEESFVDSARQCQETIQKCDRTLPESENTRTTEIESIQNLQSEFNEAYTKQLLDTYAKLYPEHAPLDPNDNFLSPTTIPDLIAHLEDKGITPPESLNNPPELSLTEVAAIKIYAQHNASQSALTAPLAQQETARKDINEQLEPMTKLEKDYTQKLSQLIIRTSYEKLTDTMNEQSAMLKDIEYNTIRRATS